MLWAFEVNPTIVNGKPYIPAEDDFTYGLVSYPANLRYNLVPRSEARRSLIVSEAESAHAAMAHLDGSPASII